MGIMSDYDLEEQQEPEQFTAEDTSEQKKSKEVYKLLRERKRYEAQQQKHNKAQQQKHKAVFHRINNINHYVCDNCGEPFPEKQGGSLIYNKNGEFFYCRQCLKELYPNYRPIHLTTTISKSKLLSNNFEEQYSKGFN